MEPCLTITLLIRPPSFDPNITHFVNLKISFVRFKSIKFYSRIYPSVADLSNLFFLLQTPISLQFVLSFCFICVNLGVESFLSVFAPSLGFLCSFIFNSTCQPMFTYGFLFCTFKPIFYIDVLQYNFSVSFGSGLAQFLSVIFHLCLQVS